MTEHNPNEYMLGCRRKLAPKHLQVDLIRPIVANDMVKVEAALKRIGDFGVYCGLYEICEKNYYSLVQYYTSIIDEFPSNRQNAQEYMGEAFQEMNRLLMNYLSSFRTYIDHLLTRYAKLKSQGYSHLETLKNITAACYDGSFSYRFFCKLRNYVQHCGLPFGSISIEESPASDGSINIDAIVCFDRDGLLNAFKKWGEVRADLLEQPAAMKFLPYLDGFRSQTQLIDLVVSSIEMSLASDSLYFINELISEVQRKFPDGMPFIGRYDESEKGNPYLRSIEFPLYEMVRFQETTNKIQKFMNAQAMRGEIGYIFQFQYEDEGGLRTVGSLRDKQVLGPDGKLRIPKIYETVLLMVGGDKKGYMIKSKHTSYHGGDIIVNFVVTDIPGKE